MFLSLFVVLTDDFFVSSSSSSSSVRVEGDAASFTPWRNHLGAPQNHQGQSTGLFSLLHVSECVHFVQQVHL